MPASRATDDDPLHFPRGPAAGEAIHHAFEKATFTDPDLDSGPADYAATVTWGDGGSSPGNIEQTADGQRENDSRERSRMTCQKPLKSCYQSHAFRYHPHAV